MASGGITTYNLREGFRSEFIATYIFSAFGPTTKMSSESDYGIDLVCNIAVRDKQVLKIGSTYGVQIKSGDIEFKYIGKQATTWLKDLEFPLLLVRVDKDESRIRIYSTWNLHNYIHMLNSDSENDYCHSVEFVTDETSGEIAMPVIELDAVRITVGKPILDFRFHDIGDNDNRDKYLSILKEWVEIDRLNINNRRSGIPVVKGFFSWKTNESLETSLREWYKPYHYSSHHADNMMNTFVECSVSLALYYKRNGNKDIRTSLQNVIKQLSLYDKLDSFQLGVFGDE